MPQKYWPINGPQARDGDFLENSSNDFDGISEIFGKYIPK
jgi:hypothetical protein